jgi:hypothetical protein
MVTIMMTTMPTPSIQEMTDDPDEQRKEELEGLQGEDEPAGDDCKRWHKR